MSKEKRPVLEVRDLFVARGDELVIKDAKFTIFSGDYVGIVGPNGGGKTTLLHSILGIIPKKSGKIRLFGEDIAHFRDWDRVAYVSQHAINFDSQFPMSVKELVTLGRLNSHTLGRRFKGKDKKKVEDVLDFMELTDVAKKRIGQLSGGQKQRVFVAKALVRDPDILFLDEPITGVDATTQERFYKKLSDLNLSRGTTILIVSHDLTAVFCRMSQVLCVNRQVFSSEITEDFDSESLLKQAYGEHFHFVFHRHQCKGVFLDERS